MASIKGTMDTPTLRIIEESFARLAPQRERVTARFYQRLFAGYPEVAPFFENTDMQEQERKLWAALVLIVWQLRKPDALTRLLYELGSRHTRMGVQAQHYRAVTDTLVQTLAECTEGSWTTEMEHAWRQALETVCRIMQEAPREASHKASGDPGAGGEASGGNVESDGWSRAGFERAMNRGRSRDATDSGRGRS